MSRNRFDQKKEWVEIVKTNNSFLKFDSIHKKKNIFRP